MNYKNYFLFVDVVQIHHERMYDVPIPQLNWHIIHFTSLNYKNSKKKEVEDIFICLFHP